MKSVLTRRVTFPVLALIVAGIVWSTGQRAAPPTDVAPPQGAAQVAAVGKPTADSDSAVPAPDRPGEDWPCFLGTQQTGHSSETGLLDSWPADGPPLLWKREVGTGYSAPSIVGNRLVMHHRRGNEEIIECLRADTGEPLWTHKYPSRFRDPYGYNNGPRCSPVLTEDSCYTLGAEGALVCTSLHDGGVCWERPLQKEFEIPQGFFGMGCSPIIDDGRLIVLVGGQPDSGVVAFDLHSGKTLWQAVGKKTWDGVPTDGGDPDPYAWTGEEMLISYSSPLVATIHGQKHLLCLMRQGLVSLDPMTGQERFHYWFRPRVHESVNAARPVVMGDRVFLSAAYRLGSAMLKVQPGGGSYEVLWKNPRNMLAHWSTPLAIGEDLYGFSGRHEEEGELRCIDAATGDVRWQTSGWDRPFNDLAQNPQTGEILDAKTKQPIPYPFVGRGSKIFADGKFIILAERGGTLMLAKPSAEKFVEVSRCAIAGMQYPSWTAPVLSRGRLYLRCEDALICLDLKKPDPAK